MIDWLTWEVRCNHPEPITGGRIIRANADGTIKEQWPLKAQVRGSYESSIQVKTSALDADGKGTMLRIDGNPAKWFQGHNVFGTDDLLGLINETMHALTPLLGLTPTDLDRIAWAKGQYTLSRVDLTHSFRLNSRHDVNAWLRAAEFTAKTRHGRCSVKGGTNYWGKHSRRWALKAYSKGTELDAKGHHLPLELKSTSIPKYADNLLRVELVLRGLELDKLGLKVAGNWAEADTMGVYNGYLKRLQMVEQMRLTPEQLDELPARLVAVYHLWLEGHDLRGMYPRKTFYRYRNELKKQGIDLSITQKDRPDTSNVIPLVRVLEAVPVTTPDWALGTPLYFEPRASIR